MEVADRVGTHGPALVIVQGFLAAGKSTWARALARATGASHLDADAHCLQRFSEAELADWDRCFAIAVDAMWDAAGDRLRAGQSAIMDHGFWTRASRDDARARAEGLAVPLVHVFLTAPEEILRARLLRRSGPVAERNLALFDTLKRQFEPPLPEEAAITIDTHAGGRVTPERVQSP